MKSLRFFGIFVCCMLILSAQGYAQPPAMPMNGFIGDTSEPTDYADELYTKAKDALQDKMPANLDPDDIELLSSMQVPNAYSMMWQTVMYGPYGPIPITNHCILYNPQFMSMSQLAANGNEFVPIGIFAHEIGHQIYALKGHHYTPFTLRTPKQSAELAADKYAGYALGELDATVQDVEAAYRIMFTLWSSPDYPETRKRMKAAIDGWKEAQSDNEEKVDVPDVSKEIKAELDKWYPKGTLLFLPFGTGADLSGLTAKPTPYAKEQFDKAFDALLPKFPANIRKKDIQFNSSAQVPNAYSIAGTYVIPSPMGPQTVIVGRRIMYNPGFMCRLQIAAGGSTEVPWAVFAHEIGHQISATERANDGPWWLVQESPWDEELKADYYSGYALAKLKVPFDKLDVTFRIMFSQWGTYSHPDSVKRIQSVVEGWKAGGGEGGDEDTLIDSYDNVDKEIGRWYRD